MSDTPTTTQAVLDPRTEAELVRETEVLAAHWTAWRPASVGQPLDFGGALVRLFAGLAHRGVERVNAAAHEHARSLLELLGARAVPPRAARTPLVFQPTPDGPGTVNVPAGTAASAPADARHPTDATFFTEDPLIATPRALVSVWSHTPSTDRMADRSMAAGPAPIAPWKAFAPASTVERAVYLACDAVVQPGDRNSFTFDFSIPVGGASWRPLEQRFEWSYWNGSAWTAVRAAEHWGVQANSPTRSPVFLHVRGRMHPVDVGGVRAHWLRGRVARPLPAGGRNLDVVGVSIRDTVTVVDPVSTVLADDLALDPTMDFAPFGEAPTFNRALYIAGGRALEASAGTMVDVDVRVATGRVARPSDALTLTWEVWTASGWTRLGAADRSTPAAIEGGAAFADGTRRLTTNGVVRFRMPAGVVPTERGGVTARWLRVRITRGDYGLPDRITARDVGGRQETRFEPSTLAPPWLAGVALRARFARTFDAASGGVRMATQLGDRIQLVDRFPVRPIEATPPAHPALWLGFDGVLPSEPLSLWCEVTSPPLDPRTGLVPARDGHDPARPPALVWEARTTRGWTAMDVEDGTAALTRPGIVRLTVPTGGVIETRFGRSAHWLRVRWIGGTYRHDVHLGRLRLNAVMARAAERIVDEVVGSSSGEPAQTFEVARTPALAGARVEVRELPDGPWVPWSLGPDFRGVSATERLCLFDPLTGRVTFGDGRAGRIPPEGIDNVRLTYTVGGGAATDRPAGAVTTVLADLPAIERVEQPVAAVGGVDGRSATAHAVLPSATRHGGRAVTADDLVALVRDVSPDIARVAVIGPGFRPSETVPVAPDRVSGRGGWVQGGKGGDGLVDMGAVTVVVVPRGADTRPTATQGLLGAVRDALGGRMGLAAITVRNPQWVDVRVSAIVGRVPGVSGVPAAARAAIDRFLHPLTGGPDGQGWAFGRRPRASDVQAVLAAVPGVRFARQVRIDCTPDLPPPEFRTGTPAVPAGALSARAAAGALVNPGAHTLTIEEA